MSKYFGLDYGTTMSLLYSFDKGVLEKTNSTLSAVRVSNGKVLEVGDKALTLSTELAHCGMLVESPKRSFNNDNLDSDRNGVTYREMIKTLLSSMINKENADIDHDSHITLTIPIGYSAKNSYDMYNILTDCLNLQFAHNNNIAIHIFPEPMAAALFYIYKHFNEIPAVCRLVVCDIGGGTTDMCIIECRKANAKLIFKVIAKNHSEVIGGNLFDRKIEQNTFFPTDLTTAAKNLICQRLKCLLSFRESASEYIDDTQVNITRDEFESYIDEELTKIQELMQDLYRDSELTVDSSWYLLPIGGSCKIPAIRRLMEKVFKGAHQTYEEEETIFDGVAQGAAIYSAWCAHALTNQDIGNITIEDCTPNEIRFKTANGSLQSLVPKNSPNGIYPPGDTFNVKPLSINTMKGEYTVGEITLMEGDRPLTRRHDRPFRLDGRKPEDIALQLGVSIEEGHIVKWWLKDFKTGEQQTWP